MVNESIGERSRTYLSLRFSYEERSDIWLKLPRRETGSNHRKEIEARKRRGREGGTANKTQKDGKCFLGGQEVGL